MTGKLGLAPGSKSSSDSAQLYRGVPINFCQLPYARVCGNWCVENCVCVRGNLRVCVEIVCVCGNLRVCVEICVRVWKYACVR